jgi:hypothetical protein
VHQPPVPGELLGQPAGGTAVDQQRGVLVGLRGVHGGVGGGVEDDGTRPADPVQPAADGLAHLPLVGQVEFGAAERRDGVAGPAGQDGEQVAAELAAGAGDQPGGRVIGSGHARVGAAVPTSRALSGSHQARLSRYHCTVRASPSSKPVRGA